MYAKCGGRKIFNWTWWCVVANWAMEQYIVIISKLGSITSLNAYITILAIASPTWYDFNLFGASHKRKYASWEPNCIHHSFNAMPIISPISTYSVTQGHNELGRHLPSLEKYRHGVPFLANRFKQHGITIKSCKIWNLTSFVIGLHVEFVRWM